VVALLPYFVGNGRDRSLQKYFLETYNINVESLMLKVQILRIGVKKDGTG